METYRIILDGPTGFGVETELPMRFLSTFGFKSKADATADETRTKANSLPDAPSRQTILKIATSGEVLARQDDFVDAAERLRGPIDNRPTTPRPEIRNQTHRRDPAVIADVIEAARRALVAPSSPRHGPDRT
jgi:hypothetical protein